MAQISRLSPRKPITYSSLCSFLGGLKVAKISMFAVVGRNDSQPPRPLDSAGHRTPHRPLTPTASPTPNPTAPTGPTLEKRSSPPYLGQS